MEIFSKATYNVGQLEDAILYIIQVCGGCLTAASLDKFAQIYARQRGKKFKQNQAVSRWMLPRMRSSGRLWQLQKNRYYTINPIAKPDTQMQNAFWAFLEFMEETELQTVSAGPPPAQISFFRSGRSYHIIAVKGDGHSELTRAAQYEMTVQQCRAKEAAEARRKGKKSIEYPEDRYIILFTSEENARNSVVRLNGMTRYGIVHYGGNTHPDIPDIIRYDPDN